MMHNHTQRISSCAILALALLAACSGGGDSSGGGGSFLVLKTEPLNNGRLYLNEPIRVDFTTNVDLNSANLSTFSFQVLDQNGSPVSEQPTGRFEIGTSPGDEAPGRRLLFIPRFPTNDTYDNGGFRPGRTYLVSLVAGNPRNGTVLRSDGGKGLGVPVSFAFSTADGTTPSQLFRDTLPGGPRKTSFTITPTPDNDGRVVLNKFGAPALELRLGFDQALNPNSSNVPVALDTDPLLRSINQRGRVFLEYDDPDPAIGFNKWIPADVDLERNDLSGSVLVLRPVGVLPNNATVRAIVENTLEDISGESNVANAAYNRVFATFRTRISYDPQFDAVVESFDEADNINFEAPFLEPTAEVDNGFVKAGFDFEGTNTTLEYRPTISEVVLSTDFTQVIPSNGSPFNVSGGVFNFRNVTIPAGVRVNGVGSNPMVWLVTGDFRVAGELSVRGGNGQRVDTLNSANFPSAGGVGVCAGGNGGKGSPSGTQRDLSGQAGFGPFQRTGGGGRPGQLSCQAACGRGSGGGGGSMSTQGDPFYKQLAGTGTTFQQQRGVGGQGCQGAAGSASRSLQGGEAGPTVFTDARTDNNFWGSAVNVQRQIRITGELASPRGGGGGGGGGDLSNSGGCNPLDVNFVNDSKGGGGGGGGGALIVKALGNIIVEPTGKILADGGYGGGGEQAGSCNQGGGGGAGAGGMVVLMAGKQIILNAKGVTAANRFTYAQNDYDFVISADGGLCTTGTFGAPVIAAKYPASGQTVLAGTQYDSAPLGALGGMGIVQLMAPPGDPNDPTANADNTNTVLDDNIIFLRDGTPQNGTAKRDLLAWRGFPNAAGILVDDFGTPTNIGANEGDIRPSPIFLPVTFSNRTRLRSKWIDTGSSKRRPLAAPDNQPRGIVQDTVNNLLAGPTYEFAGTFNNPTGLTHGYANYQVDGTSAKPVYPVAVNYADILGINANASFSGQPAIRVELTSPALGTIVDRYSQYEVQFASASADLNPTFRILSHSDRILFLSPTSGAIPEGATRLRVLSKFFEIRIGGVQGSETLGGTYAGSLPNSQIPIANVRIGFAFHQDPASPTAQRFPANPSQFVLDLTDPAVQDQIRLLGASYVQWDILFNTGFKSVVTDVPPGLSPSSPRPELHFLRIPYRF